MTQKLPQPARDAPFARIRRLGTPDDIAPRCLPRWSGRGLHHRCDAARQWRDAMSDNVPLGVTIRGWPAGSSGEQWQALVNPSVSIVDPRRGDA
jgi:hypothetical protein